MHTRFEVTENCLQATFHGPFDTGEMCLQVPLLFNRCLELGLSRILVDFRHLDGDMLTTHEAIFAIKIREAYLNDFLLVGQSLALAIVCRKGQMTYTPTVDLLSGTGLKVFVSSDSDTAMSWLVRTDTGDLLL